MDGDDAGLILCMLKNAFFGLNWLSGFSTEFQLVKFVSYYGG
jgi:hypothetical protein